MQSGSHFVRALASVRFYLVAMTIWLLALVLLASLAGLGYRQGAIRVACALVGIFTGLLLAAPLAKLARVRSGLEAVGVHNPVLLWVLPAFIAFLVVLTLFKIAGWEIKRRVDVYFKYHASDLRKLQWERLTARLGLCLGLVNATLYLALLSTVIYAVGYWTVQLASGSDDPTMLRLVDRLGRDVQSTGLSKVAKALDPLPAVYFDAADLAGIIYHTPLIEARLSKYPGFMSLAQQPDIQLLGMDPQFSEMRLKQDSIKKLLAYPTVDSMLKKPETLNLIWTNVTSDLTDLRTYLETGKSPKYDKEKILGRWNFQVNGAFAAIREAKPTITSREMQAVRTLIIAGYSKSTLIASPDHQIILKDALPLSAPPSTPSPGRAAMPPTMAPTQQARGRGASPPPAAPQPSAVPNPATPTLALQTLNGRWRKSGGQYQISFDQGARAQWFSAEIEGDRLTISAEFLPMAFKRED